MKRYEVAEGCEIRGFKIRIYPTNEQVQMLEILESDLKKCWNWLCKQTQEVIDARCAYAIRYGLVGTRPSRPEVSEGMIPDEISFVWDKYHKDCIDWHRSVYSATDKLVCCIWRPKIKEMIEMYSTDDRPLKFDYQFFRSVVLHYEERSKDDPKLCAHAIQALVKNYFSGRAANGGGRAKNQRRKKFRRGGDSMPLQVLSDDCFRLGDFTPKYDRTGRHKKFDCQISFNGLKIPGKLPGRPPWGRVLEGVSLCKEADGWWASIKQEIPIRKLQEPIHGTVIGIDAGLDLIVAMSDGTKVRNPREKEFSERIAGRQSMGKPVGRLQQKAAKHIRHLIYNEVVKPLEKTEVIKLEKLNGMIGQMGSRKTSSMRLVAQILKDRYRSRVREVECSFTSQDCSQCGKRSKESWSYAHGRIGSCPYCGYTEDRDVNAARNIAAKSVISQEAAE